MTTSKTTATKTRKTRTTSSFPAPDATASVEPGLEGGRLSGRPLFPFRELVVGTVPRVILPDMCQLHQSLLIHQVGIPESGPWRAAIVVAQITLFQGTTAKQQAWDAIGGDVSRIAELGCLGCYSPDVFGQIVDAFQTGGFAAVKALGERICDEGKK